MGFIIFILVVVGAWVTIKSLSNKGLSKTIKDAKIELQDTLEVIKENKKNKEG